MFQWLKRKITALFKCVVNFIKYMFGKNKEKKRPRNNEDNDMYFHADNNDWVKVRNKAFSKHNEENTEEEEDHVPKMKDKYGMTNKDTMTIFLKDVEDKFVVSKMCRTEPDKRMTLVRHEDKACLYPRISLIGKEARIFTGHTYELFQNDHIKDKMLLNPQVVVIPSSKNTIPVTHFTKIETATIMTMTCDDQQHCVIETYPTTLVNAMYFVKGKPKLGTIALVFTISPDEDYIWSGSLVRYGKAMFIISNVTKYADTGVIKIVAFAIATHNIKIITE